MLNKNHIFPYLSILILTLVILVNSKSMFAQELPIEDLNPGVIIVDTIDYSEDLIDSNEVYKKQFDSLSKEGEWVEIEKSEFLQELNENTDEIQDFGEIENSTQIIYVWRPYTTDYYWNPYINGSWIFTNFGWVWNSYYNWGWAPYNYGRWYCSNYYGWVWFPGNVWAPNYVSWRNSGNYVGWYPTCPRFRWRGRGTHVYTNHLYAYNPQNWVFVNQKDFTKKINKNIIVKSEDNRNLLKKSEKLNITTYNDPSMAKFKYKGPDAVSLAVKSGTRINPRIITAGSSGYINPDSRDNVNSTTRSENPNIKNFNNTKTENTSKVNKQYNEKKKTQSTDKVRNNETNQNSVKKNQDKKTDNNSTRDSKKENNIKNSDNKKSNSDSNNMKKNGSSNNNNSRKSSKKIR